jgi:hypothetical protein
MENLPKETLRYLFEVLQADKECLENLLQHPKQYSTQELTQFKQELIHNTELFKVLQKSE